MMTGQYPHNHGSRRNETLLEPGREHAFRIWKEAGYATGLIGKNHCFQPPDRDAHFDVWCEITHDGIPPGSETKGMDWWRDLAGVRQAHATRRGMPWQTGNISYAVTDHPLEDYSSGLIAGQVQAFLEKHRKEPFALWVSFPDPHTPWEAPRQYVDLFDPEKITIPPWRREEFTTDAPERNQVLHQILGVEDDPPEEIRKVIAVYYAMIRFIDNGVGQILDSLDRLGLREETIVVFASDHGDLMGEHMMVNKGGLFYDALTRVPLLFSWPGHLPEGVEGEGMANLLDIVPTLLTLQNLEVPRSMDGRPLPTVAGGEAQEAVFSEYGAGGPPFTREELRQLDPSSGDAALMESLRAREAEGRRKMVRTGEWKYVHDPAGDRDELYDLLRDPWELTNVASLPENREVICELSRRLMDWSIGTEDARPVPLP
jgi:arylsulfatase A-like enzyme